MGITRRKFLEDSLLAAAAASVPGALASCAGSAPAQKMGGANDRLRIAIIGVRGQGRVHASSFTTLPDVEVAAVCDIDPSIIGEAMQTITDKNGKKPAFVTDFRRILDDKSIDAITVAMPNHWHVLAGIWGVQAGKDVYLEKPISYAIWEGRRLIEAVRKSGKIVQQGNRPRSAQITRDGMAYLHSGKLGKIKFVRAVCYNLRPSIGKKADEAVPAGVDYNLWQGPAPERPFNPNRFHYNWHWNWTWGNGELGNNGIYQMDLVRWGLQKSEHPKRVLSVGGRYGYEDDGITPNSQVTFLDYGDVQVVHEVRGLKTDKMRGLGMGVLFECEKGYMVFPNSGAEAFDPDGKSIVKFTKENDKYAHMQNWVDAVRSRRPADLNSEANEGHLSSAMCHLGNTSFRLGQEAPLTEKAPFGKDDAGNQVFAEFRDYLAANEVDLQKAKFQKGRALTFDPQKERFVDCPEADALLRRPEYRAPFVVPENV